MTSDPLLVEGDGALQPLLQNSNASSTLVVPYR